MDLSHGIIPELLDSHLLSKALPGRTKLDRTFWQTFSTDADNIDTTKQVQ